MTKEELEGNKLIANSIFCPDFVKINIDHHTETGNDIGLVDYMGRLNFHSSWDWLMPVFYKFINAIKFKEQNDEWLRFTTYRNRIHDALIHRGIYATFFELVNAIEWYNSQKL
jgi:hypothetical protein